jgi:hypothetical protein
MSEYSLQNVFWLHWIVVNFWKERKRKKGVTEISKNPNHNRIHALFWTSTGGKEWSLLALKHKNAHKKCTKKLRLIIQPVG